MVLILGRSKNYVVGKKEIKLNSVDFLGLLAYSLRVAIFLTLNMFWITTFTNITTIYCYYYCDVEFMFI